MSCGRNRTERLSRSQLSPVERAKLGCGWTEYPGQPGSSHSPFLMFTLFVCDLRWLGNPECDWRLAIGAADSRGANHRGLPLAVLPVYCCLTRFTHRLRVRA
ncbi:hypothetical protein CALCODRAFT_52790 [Calocera cornea HHB12733]|uniref:Uncharacterized protein n=1 Tax=Calocera cornea HHB12733 TaxID=1353952 RepID=A0A165DRA8_9BASI|nr:hypothetical protein CALCODRAFT_52790 [Calocera cornea HHB12733]